MTPERLNEIADATPIRLVQAIVDSIPIREAVRTAVREALDAAAKECAAEARECETFGIEADACIDRIRSLRAKLTGDDDGR